MLSDADQNYKPSIGLLTGKNQDHKMLFYFHPQFITLRKWQIHGE